MTKKEQKKIDELRAERTSTNNKLSGMRTRLKRVAGDAEKEKEVNGRIEALTTRRAEINAELEKLEGGSEAGEEASIGQELAGRTKTGNTPEREEAVTTA